MCIFSMSFCKCLSAWPSHLARLASAISKWLCSFYHVIFSSWYLFILLYFLGTNKDMLLLYVVVVVEMKDAHAGPAF